MSFPSVRQNGCFDPAAAVAHHKAKDARGILDYDYDAACSRVCEGIKGCFAADVVYLVPHNLAQCTHVPLDIDAIRDCRIEQSLIRQTAECCFEAHGAVNGAQATQSFAALFRDLPH